MATKCPYCNSTDVTVGAGNHLSCLQCKNGEPEKKGKP